MTLNTLTFPMFEIMSCSFCKYYPSQTSMDKGFFSAVEKF